MFRYCVPIRFLSIPLLVLALAACDNAESRAARHLANAEALVAEGDLGAAVLEFRNVLQHDPTHRAALEQLAAIQLDSGAENAAFGTYQRLVDNHPDVADGWIALAEIAIRNNRWDQVPGFAEQAVALAPEDSRTELVTAAIDFRAAAEALDISAATDASAVARDHAAREPDNLIARQILVAHAGTFLDPEDVLAEVEMALPDLPGNYPLHQIRVQTLSELGRVAEVGPALEAMAGQFPEESEPRQLLVDWYMRQGDLDAVERFLRAEAAAEDAPFAIRMNLVNFLRETQGPEATLAEIERQIAAMPAATEQGDDRNRDLLRGLRATLRFDLGDPEEALAELDAVLDSMAEGEEADNLRVARARLLMALGREEAAEAEIDAVLARDSGQVEAIKIRAAALIEADAVDEAVRLLRQAQATSPRDAEVVRMMGDAHARAGSWDLAGERYATAVSLSGNAARETLAYTDFLRQRDQQELAPPILLDALRRAPGDVALIRSLVDVYLDTNQIDQARRGIAQLRALDTPAARQMADMFEVDALRREGRIAEMSDLVETMAGEGRGSARDLTAVIQARIAEGRTDEAAALLERQLAAFPEDPTLRFLQAGLFVADGTPDLAEPIYREILADTPAAAPPLRVLHGLLMMQGRTDEAQALVQDIHAAAPQATLARLLLAEHAERDGDAAAAIDLYESLYAEDDSNLVVANNLANLLMQDIDDQAAIDRASTITRRLRGTDVPAFQDTYGWLAYLQGDYDTALEYLSAAAAALPDEPTVLYHLGMTQSALGQTEEARASLQRALELGESFTRDPEGGRALAARARTALEAL